VKLAALNATISFLLAIEDKAQRNVFSDLLSPMLQVLLAPFTSVADPHETYSSSFSSFFFFSPSFKVIALALNNQDEDAARDAISSFIDLAESTPAFLRKSLDSLIPAMCQISSSSTVEDGTRHLAVELLVTLSERASPMIRKYGKFVEQVYPACWSLMVDIEDDDDWQSSDEVSPRAFLTPSLIAKIILIIINNNNRLAGRGRS